MSLIKFLQCFLFVSCIVLVLPTDINDKFQQCSDQNNSFDSILIVGLTSAFVFCFIGILPSFFIRTDADEKKFINSSLFKLLLAFAAGSLIGDVFLHLLPEISHRASESQLMINGLIIISSFLLFLIVEILTELVPNAHALGTLNLIANFLDNSVHGTTVVGAFKNSFKFGMVALLATILHEVPHEFSDFALLLRDGYSRKKAVFAQLITAFSGTITATLASAFTLSANSLDCVKDNHNMYKKESQIGNIDQLHGHHGHGSYILPFTIGGFLYIALVGIIPDIINEENKKTTLLQILSFILGTSFIFFLTQFETLMAHYFTSPIL
ncbi:zinc transporter ZIP13 -like protein [Brachionus plicatilis]|uniref:Zinc transporter ZIP13-like protein n=1 Tax=Brachionus plicatilis TaxID=10195 RepID=A0A3M7R5S9_BRAPC|nr:zinc transporter ZIP13 -like protein [Brachionus plicatilis]